MNASYGMCAYVAGDPHAAENRDDVGEDRQQRQHHEQRQQPRHDEEARRFQAHRAQRLDLFGHDHRTEFGGDRRADAPRDDDCR